MKKSNRLNLENNTIKLGKSKKLTNIQLKIFKWYLRYVTFYAGYIDLRKFRFIELLKICMTNVKITKDNDGLEVFNLLYFEGFVPGFLYPEVWHVCDFFIFEEIGLIMRYLLHKSSVFPIDGIFDVKIHRIIKKVLSTEVLPLPRYRYGPVMHIDGGAFYQGGVFLRKVITIGEDVTFQPLTEEDLSWETHPRYYRVVYTLWCSKYKCKIKLYWIVYTAAFRNHNIVNPMYLLRDFLDANRAHAPRVWDNSQQFYLAWYLTVFLKTPRKNISYRKEIY